jgi:hypothetical protein
MPLAAASELRDELLGLVQLAAEPVPLLGRALRERLARVAGVQLADGGHALPLPGPELPYGRRPLRIAAPAFPSRPHESHPFDPVPVARVAPQRARLPRGMEGTSCIPVRPHRDQRPPLAMGRAYADECLGQDLVRLPRRETDRGSRRTRGTCLVVGSRRLPAAGHSSPQRATRKNARANGHAGLPLCFPERRPESLGQTGNMWGPRTRRPHRACRTRLGEASSPAETPRAAACRRREHRTRWFQHPSRPAPRPLAHGWQHHSTVAE